MKMFTKLALVSSIAISANAMAMQSMDDAALSSTTGQDGLNIGIGISKVTIDQLAIHDNDGLATANGGTGEAGAIVIKANGDGTNGTVAHGVEITANTSSLLASHNLADLTIDTDAGTNGAFLNVGAQVSGLVIKVGEIGVDKSNDYTTGAVVRGVEGGSSYNKILNGLTITTGVMDANIQLGSAPQGAMIKLNSTMQGGLELSNLSIHDGSTNGGGDIVLDSIKVASVGSSDLALDASVSVTTGGLKITSNDATGNNIYIKGVHLGSAAAGSIGDVEVSGLRTYYGLNGTAGSQITITGH
ncbi:pilus assembly protein FilA [Acinetobacter sp. S40]|uniref:putative pilus system protein FilA n=1 Tax=unclassified Acinetobacter TaxID=196816 RepID=UPI001909B186|nr:MULTISPECIES: DUF6160 family protein [unclassified Acinetobacter]MBJ9985927.1 pilus assembly protein FilA [Acinetobacter sp. S40]MBK0064430.1 pilus assembly protein FilA [Acinetobacter sp. S55]MBK0067128.1 pilus assembly protein FilA [Acinetobacter sp. S54]